jgi:hypothetical protein
MIIGLVGFIGAGKGTVADMLVDEHGFLKESFAGGVKDAAAVIFGWDRKMLEGDTADSRAWREQPDPFWSAKFGRDFTPRYALQLMGTEAGRDVFHKNLWIYNMEKRCDVNKNYVIADVRFPNEMAEIRNAGGKIIRVKRGDEPVWFDLALKVNEGKFAMSEMYSRYPDVHYSEWAWIGHEVDAVIYNDFDLERLDVNVKSVLHSFF